MDRSVQPQHAVGHAHARGRAILRRCQAILGEVEAAEQEIAELNAAPRRAAGSGSACLSSHADDAGRRGFAEAYPEVDLDFSDRLIDVIEEGFDVVLRTGTAATRA